MTLARARVVITGGTRGIGRALAEALVQEGSEVLVCGRDDAALAAVRRDLGVRALRCDITDPADVARLADVVRAELCGVDLLINNAGRQVDHDVVTGLDMSAARDEVAVNLLAPIAVTAALMPLLLASSDAAVVNVSSALAFAPAPRSPVYAASKAGLAAWTHALRAQLEGTAVRVVDVVPPLVATDMTVGRHEGAVQPEAVAAAVVRGLTRRRTRVVVGKARALAAIHRVSPALARRMMRDR
ncbi:MAG: SDR family NAD(P)-dependent oxidoreductase [Myxococcales bacterium]|nr:SDR family NAD(P)-dependent oxidoreductase [Myxococcales bacterium]